MSTASKSFRCETVSWNTVHNLARRLAHIVRNSGFQPDAIVAIGRGGYIPGRLLSDLLDIFDLTSFKIEHYRQGARREPEAKVRYPLCADLSGKRVLIVDDVSDTGDTFALAVNHLRERSDPTVIRTAALHHKTVSTFEPDYYAHKIVKWRWLVYPWALIEDTSGFIARLQPTPRTPEEASKRLASEFGLNVSKTVIEDAFSVLGRKRP